MSHRTLNPDGHYSAHDLWLRLNIDPQVIELARTNGRLQAIKLQPAKHGEQFLYSGRAVISWLEEGAPTLRGPTPRSAGTSSNGGNRSHYSHSGDQPMRDPKTRVTAQWEAAIAEKMRQGKTRERATREVVRENPDLHKSYLCEFNRDRPAALHGIVAA